MPLKIYNTLTKSKEEFVPLNQGEVGIYVCGVTVYDLCHIGHARSLIVFDVIYRYLKHLGYRIKFVRNYTDIDDKIIDRAKREDLYYSEIAERYIKEFDKDAKSLGLEMPTYSPKATDHIDDMLKMVQVLLDKGFAYEVDGDIYFSVERFEPYGRLSGKGISQLRAGERVEIDPRKKNPLDFALWKQSKPGEPFWESPWGKGRPGWHIECSAMSQKYLGLSFDIHGGGMDLIFPHHENEIAQSEAASGKPMVHYWIHNGFVNISKEKMSKSLGNILTIQEILKDCHPEALRLYLLSSHYRSPLDFSEVDLQKAEKNLLRLYQLLEDLEGLLKKNPERVEAHSNRSGFKGENEIKGALATFSQKFREAMDNDFNTPIAIGHTFDLFHAVNGFMPDLKKAKMGEAMEIVIKETLEKFQGAGGVLGLFSEDPTTFLEAKKKKKMAALQIDADWVQSLIEKRDLARREKKWDEADKIRADLAKSNIVLLDSPSGTEWRIEDST